MKNFVIPSIDLLDGQIVRLFKGNYGEKTVYNVEIDDLLAKYQGFGRLHIVDLNGAKGDGITNIEMSDSTSTSITNKRLRTEFESKTLLHDVTSGSSIITFHQNFPTRDVKLVEVPLRIKFY